MSIAKIKVGLISLGCAKNLVDSEIILGYLKEHGYQLEIAPEEADVIIINTCGFIGPAKEESINTILEMANYKESGNCKALIVTGCLSARYSHELIDELPEIDGILGNAEMDQIHNVITSIFQGKKVHSIPQSKFSYDQPAVPRVLATGNHMAYLKISEGCNHSCAFCVIPKIRGRLKSRSIASIVAEARALSEVGVKEINLIAQDSTSFGRDIGLSINDLIKELVKVDIPWIRLLYAYPSQLSEELLELIATNEKIVKYIDLPLQHASKSILSAMRRPGDFEKLLTTIKSIKDSIPEVFLRSTFIVGFPGETNDDFSLLYEFLKEARLNHVGVFKYSQEEDTLAFSMPNQVPEEIKEERYQSLMTLQQRISLELNEQLVGKTFEVLIEGRSTETDLLIQGRHYGQAPEVDGVIYIGNKLAKAGEFKRVTITEAHPYDLVGEIVGGSEI